MEEDGFAPNECSYSVIINGFLRNKSFSGAIELIEEMREKDLSASNSTIELVVDTSATVDFVLEKLGSFSKGFLGDKAK